MILPKSIDAVHRFQLYRCLMALFDDSFISQSLFFKGGTCAAMLGYLDRFSLDLDFDLKQKQDKKILDNKLKVIFKKLDYTVSRQRRNELFYVLKYALIKSGRNTIKLGITPMAAKSNRYGLFYLQELDRYARCQTIETMFAHKLVSMTDRFRKYKMVAGRDLYDIHHFFLQGYGYIKEVIQERTGKRPVEYFRGLADFIKKKVNDTIISEDLNYLLPIEKLPKIRKALKKETLVFLASEINRLK